MASRKTVTFAIMHMSVAFAIVYLLTGSLALGGAVALIEPAVNTVAYFFHEKVWERFGLGSTRKAAPKAPSQCPFQALTARPADPLARCLQCQWRARPTGGTTLG
ncbi:MAG: DUF2061 domain-containing protein [Gammaproteobacteria bacterium]|jgi:uncharacterized membrane protein|nr:DUF2061 domain-containing protein [Gammaproteobacteria bacterium]